MEHHPGSGTDLHRALPPHREEVQIRLYAEHLEVYYKDSLIERMERVRGEREARVDYRHVIGSWCASRSLCQVPFREQMFLTLTSGWPTMPSGNGGASVRRGVRAHPAPFGDDHGVHGGQRPALLLKAGEPFD